MIKDFKWLCEEMERAGAKVTFSRNCCSGIVGLLKDGSVCQCWRCRKGRGEGYSAETELIAEALSRRAQRVMRETVRVMEIL